MIDRREILDAASSTFQLLPSVVEKDYVLGWLLGGIDVHPALSGNWIFKGGTCLKKCYFETYRFSEDLDFTLRDESQIDETVLLPILQDVVAWVAEQSGLEVLQLCSHPVIGLQDAPPGIFGLWFIQVAAI